MKLAVALAFLSGFIALSLEIVWFRVYSFVSGGRADAFALMLCGYLLGIALGAAAARSLCGEPTAADRVRLLSIAAALFAASAGAFFLPPAVAAAVTWIESWELSLPLVVIASALLGAVFPLVSHAAIAPDERSGVLFSYVYLGNILGSAAGSLGTGFWLLERWPLSRVMLFLALLSLGAAAAIALRQARRLAVIAPLAAAAACIALVDPLYASLYERLQFKAAYRPGEAFTRVIENRSGIITVSTEGVVYGGGLYDGAYNTSPVRDVNGIMRAYALAALHPAPRKVLMVGLSSGSWAAVVANHPGLEELTIVEINPGYVELLAEHPEMAAVLHHPKVRIEIDDARRWLVRHPDRRFDVVVSNNTMHWRANMTNLLSREFAELVRLRLAPGGLYYFNATGSERAARTAADVFRYAAGIGNCIAASDRPIELDIERWKAVTARYLAPAERASLESLAEKLRLELYVPDSVLRRRTAGVQPITDDNMGTEWR